MAVAPRKTARPASSGPGEPSIAISAWPNLDGNIFS